MAYIAATWHHTAVSCHDFFAPFDPVTFDLLTNTNWWARYHDGLCLYIVFDDFSFSRFDIIMWTDRQTESQSINAMLPSARVITLILVDITIVIR